MADTRRFFDLPIALERRGVLAEENPDEDPAVLDDVVVQSKVPLMLRAFSQVAQEGEVRELAEEFNRISAEPDPRFQRVNREIFADKLTNIINQKHKDQLNFFERNTFEVADIPLIGRLSSKKTGIESLTDATKLGEFSAGQAPTSVVVQEAENVGRTILAGGLGIIDGVQDWVAGKDVKTSAEGYAREVLAGRGRIPDDLDDGGLFPLDPQIWAHSLVKNAPSTVMMAAQLAAAFTTGGTGNAVLKGLMTLGTTSLVGQSTGDTFDMIKDIDMTPGEKLMTMSINSAADFATERVGNLLQTKAFTKFLKSPRMNIVGKALKDPNLKAKIMVGLGKSTKFMAKAAAVGAGTISTEIAEELSAEALKITLNQMIFQPQIQALESAKELLSRDPKNKDLLAEVAKLQDTVDRIGLEFEGSNFAEIARMTTRDTLPFAILGVGGKAINDRRFGKKTTTVETNNKDFIQLLTDMDASLGEKIEGIHKDSTLDDKGKQDAQNQIEQEVVSLIEHLKHRDANNITDEDLAKVKEKLSDKGLASMTDGQALDYVEGELQRVMGTDNADLNLGLYANYADLSIENKVLEGNLLDETKASRTRGVQLVKVKAMLEKARNARAGKRSADAGTALFEGAVNLAEEFNDSPDLQKNPDRLVSAIKKFIGKADKLHEIVTGLEVILPSDFNVKQFLATANNKSLGPDYVKALKDVETRRKQRAKDIGAQKTAVEAIVADIRRTDTIAQNNKLEEAEKEILGGRDRSELSIEELKVHKEDIKVAKARIKVRDGAIRDKRRFSELNKKAPNNDEKKRILKAFDEATSKSDLDAANDLAGKFKRDLKEDDKIDIIEEVGKSQLGKGRTSLKSRLKGGLKLENQGALDIELTERIESETDTEQLKNIRKELNRLAILAARKAIALSEEKTFKATGTSTQLDALVKMFDSKIAEIDTQLARIALKKFLAKQDKLIEELNPKKLAEYDLTETKRRISGLTRVQSSLLDQSSKVAADNPSLSPEFDKEVETRNIAIDKMTSSLLEQQAVTSSREKLIDNIKSVIQNIRIRLNKLATRVEKAQDESISKYLDEPITKSDIFARIQELEIDLEVVIDRAKKNGENVHDVLFQEYALSSSGIQDLYNELNNNLLDAEIAAITEKKVLKMFKVLKNNAIEQVEASKGVPDKSGNIASIVKDLHAEIKNVPSEISVDQVKAIRDENSIRISREIKDLLGKDSKIAKLTSDLKKAIEAGNKAEEASKKKTETPKEDSKPEKTTLKREEKVEEVVEDQELEPEKEIIEKEESLEEDLDPRAYVHSDEDSKEGVDELMQFFMLGRWAKFQEEYQGTEHKLMVDIMHLIIRRLGERGTDVVYAITEGNPDLENLTFNGGPVIEGIRGLLDRPESSYITEPYSKSSIIETKIEILKIAKEITRRRKKTGKNAFIKDLDNEIGELRHDMVAEIRRENLNEETSDIGNFTLEDQSKLLEIDNKKLIVDNQEDQDELDRLKNKLMHKGDDSLSVDEADRAHDLIDEYLPESEVEVEVEVEGKKGLEVDDADSVVEILKISGDSPAMLQLQSQFFRDFYSPASSLDSSKIEDEADKRPQSEKRVDDALSNFEILEDNPLRQFLPQSIQDKISRVQEFFTSKKDRLAKGDHDPDLEDQMKLGTQGDFNQDLWASLVASGDTELQDRYMFTQRTNISTMKSPTKEFILGLPDIYLSQLREGTREANNTGLNIKNMIETLESYTPTPEINQKLEILRYEKDRQDDTTDFNEEYRGELKGLKGEALINRVVELMGPIMADINTGLADPSLAVNTDIQIRVNQAMSRKYELLGTLHDMTVNPSASDYRILSRYGPNFMLQSLIVDHVLAGGNFSEIPDNYLSNSSDVSKSHQILDDIPREEDVRFNGESSIRVEGLKLAYDQYQKDTKGSDTKLFTLHEDLSDPDLPKGSENLTGGMVKTHKDGSKRVHIYLPNISSPEALMETLRHEEFGHIILEHILGEKDYNALVEFVIKNGGIKDIKLKDITDKYEAVRKREGKDLKSFEIESAAREAIAFYVQGVDNIKPLSIMQRVLNKIRRFFKRISGIEMSERDAVNAVKLAYMNYAKGDSVKATEITNTNNEVLANLQVDVDQSVDQTIEVIDKQYQVLSFMNDSVDKAWKEQGVFITKTTNVDGWIGKINEYISQEFPVGNVEADIRSYLEGKSEVIEEIIKEHPKLKKPFEDTQEAFLQWRSEGNVERKARMSSGQQTRVTKLKRLSKNIFTKTWDIGGVKNWWANNSAIVNSANVLQTVVGLTKGNSSVVNKLANGLTKRDKDLYEAYNSNEFSLLTGALGSIEESSNKELNGIFSVEKKLEAKDEQFGRSYNVSREKLGESLMSRLGRFFKKKDGSSNIDDVNKYLEAHEVIDADLHGRANHTDLTLEGAEKIVAELNDDMFDSNGVNIVDELLDYYRTVARVMSQSGGFSQYEVQEMMNRTSTRSLLADNRNFYASDATGAPAQPPLQSIIAETVSKYQTIVGQRWDISLHNFLAEQVSTDNRKVNAEIEEMNHDQLAQLDERLVSTISSTRRAAFDDFNSAGRGESGTGSKIFLYTMMINGEPRYYKIRNKALFDSLQSRRQQFKGTKFSNAAAQLMVNAAMYQSKLIRSMVVYDPAFLARNVWMDLLGSWGMGYTDIPSIKNIIGSSFIKGGLKDEIIKEMVIMGSFDIGQELSQDMDGREIYKKAEASLRARGNPNDRFPTSNVWDGTKNMGRGLKNLFDGALQTSEAVGRTSIVLSTMARFRDYTMEAGISEKEKQERYWAVVQLAHKRSRDVLNFKMTGNVPTINTFLKSIAFGRVGLTGIEKATRVPFEVWNNPDLRKPFMHHMALLGAFSALLAFANSDDEEYMSQPNYVKASHLSIPLSDGSRVNLRKGFGWVGGVMNATESFIYAVKRERGHDFASDIIKGMFEDILPNFPGISNGIRAMATSLGVKNFNPRLSTTPNAFLTIADLIQNRDSFRGRKIVQAFIDGDDAIPSSIYTGREDWMALWLGQKLNMSPARLQFIWDKTAGGGGALDPVIWGAKKAINSFADEPIIGREDFPLFEGLITKRGVSNQGSMGQFFEMYNEMKAVAQQKSQAEKLSPDLKELALHDNELRKIDIEIVRKLKGHYKWLKRAQKGLKKLPNYTKLSKSERQDANTVIYRQTQNVLMNIRALQATRDY